MEEPDVEYALKACRSLGIISAGREGWGIERFLRGDWEHQEGTSVIHLFPWGIEDEDDRPDKAWLIVDFESDGSHVIHCKRDAKNGDHITLSSGSIPAGEYPKSWHEAAFYTRGGSSFLRFNPDNEITIAQYHDSNPKNTISARIGVEGIQAVDNVLVKIRNSLGLGTGLMPNRTDVNPNVLMNIMLDRGQPFDVPQMVASAHL